MSLRGTTQPTHPRPPMPPSPPVKVAASFEEWARTQPGFGTAGSAPDYRIGAVRIALSAWHAALASQASLAKRGTEPSDPPPPAEINPEPVYRLLRRALIQLAQWQRKYGEHNPEWLPPSGDVRLAEDIDAMLNQVPESAPSEKLSGAEPVLIASQDDLREARDHCLYASDMDLRHQGKALQDWAIPALEYALASHAETVPHVPAGQGLQVLSEVVRLLRKQGHYEDEEGEATNALEDLLASMQAEAPQATKDAVFMPTEPTPAMLYAMWQHRHYMTGQSENEIAREGYRALRIAARKSQGEAP